MYYWVALIFAGLLEVVWSYTMKLSHGFTLPIYTAITLIAMIISFTLLGYAMKFLPLGTAYIIWTGIGAVGAFLVGIIILGEPLTWMRSLAALLIVSGLVLMQLSTQ